MSGLYRVIVIRMEVYNGIVNIHLFG